MIEYYELGSVCQDGASNFSYPMTHSLINACSCNAYIEIVEFRILNDESGTTEIIVVDAADGTVAHNNVGGICRNERLAITIAPQNRVPVVVRPLRKSFPALSHQHPSAPNTPRMLCLYNAHWSSVQRGWTAERFIQRVFWWLRESSQLRLHRDDQPLEQLFYLAPYQLILPSNYLDFFEGKNKFLLLQEVAGPPGSPQTIRAHPATEDEVKKSGVKGFRLIPIMVDGIESAVVESFPENLGALHDRLLSWGSNLSSPLKQAVIQMISGGISKKNSIQSNLLILVSVPRIRDEIIERYDILAYLVLDSLFDLATSLDLITTADAKGIYHYSALVGQPIDVPSSDDWKSKIIYPVEVRVAMNQQRARNISAIEDSASDFNGILAGVGSLGGLLADMWIRQGWGQWTFVDPDQLLPHNIPRHVAFDGYLGEPKTNVLQNLAGAIYPANQLPVSIAGSVTDDTPQLIKAFSESSLLVDVTTTFYAPRDLSARENVPRICSLFLTPSGNGCVMLLEDSSRDIRASDLEGQYYRAVINNDWGKDHLKNHFGDVWVGGGCRDISVRLPYDRIHLHAGILSNQIRSSVLKKEARACVWEVDDSTGAVSVYEIELHAVHQEKIGVWQVSYDDAIVKKLERLRLNSLPAETGGIILGVTDMSSRNILIVDVIAAPLDSEASASHFIRGKEGQEDLLQEVLKRTANIVDYIGEWHSHPDGCSTNPSHDDNKLLNDLSERMSSDGLPGVILIAGEKNISVYVK